MRMINNDLLEQIRRMSEQMGKIYDTSNSFNNKAAYTECPRYHQVIDPIPPGTIDLTFEEVREK